MKEKGNPIEAAPHFRWHAVAALILAAGLGRGGQVAETPAEFLGRFDDGVSYAVVDRQTGQVRAGTMAGDGTISLRPPLRTGVHEVSDIATGILGKEGEALGLTSPTTNEVRLVQPGAEIPVLVRFPGDVPEPGFLSEIGEEGKTATPLAVLSALDPATSHLGIYEEVVDKPTRVLTDAVPEFFGAEPLCVDFSNPEAPRHPVLLARETAVARPFLLRLNSEAIQLDGGPLIPPTARCVPNVGTLDGRFGLVVTVPGANALSFIEVIDPAAGDAQFGAGVDLEKPGFAVGQVAPVDLDGQPGILVIRADGQLAVQFVISETNELEVIDTLEPPPGQSFRGALGFPGSRLAMFSGSGGAQASEAVSSFQFSGGAWNLADQAAIPALLGPEMDRSTLFFYQGHPFLDTDPQLILLRPEADWTRKADDSIDLPSTVLAASFAPGSGLASGAATSVAAPPTADYLMVNQFAPQVSITARESNLALLTPDLRIVPESPDQATGFLARAIYDMDAYRAYYRQAGRHDWCEYLGPIAIAYTGTWEFFLEEIATGRRGPVQSQSWTVAPDQLLDRDLDGDGVPDFVEREAGLDPQGGADSDGDGASDLEELLSGTDPADSASRPVDGDDRDYRDRPFTGDGFRLLARAHDGVGQPMALGESMWLYSSNGRFFDTASVEDIPAHAVLGSLSAARLFVENAQPRKYLFALSSPTFFDSGGGGQGREMIRFLAQPEHAPPSISPTLTGTDRTADAAAWIAAAQAAYAGYEPVTQLDEVHPADSARTVVLELAIYDVLADRSLISVAGPEGFTLMPWRSQDVARQRLTDEMIDDLVAEGFSFEKLLDEVDAAFDQPDADTQALIQLAEALHQKHVTDFDTDPGIPFPIDALRQLAGTGSLPASVSTVATVPDVQAASSAMQQHRGLYAQAFRPDTQWVITIDEVERPTGVYLRDDGLTVQLLDRNGEPLGLERDLGLDPGTELTVRGFTDVTAASGLPAIEAIRILAVTTTTASDNDQDGNLLDDEWERFYFGEIGQDPYANNGLSPHSYLQHFLGGTDPRGEIPAMDPVDLSPPQPSIQVEADGDIVLTWPFPAAYQAGVTFAIHESTDLSGFEPRTGLAIFDAIGDTMQVNLGPDPAVSEARFYKLVMSLDTP